MNFLSYSQRPVTNPCYVFQIRSVCPNNTGEVFARIISVRENLPSKHPALFSPGLWVTRGHLRRRGSPWSVTVGVGDCRLGSEIRYRAVLWAQTGVKDCAVEEERGSHRRGGRWTMSHPRPSLTVYLAHTSARRGRSGRHLGSPQFETRRSNKVQVLVTGQSGRLSLRRSLIALDLDSISRGDGWRQNFCGRNKLESAVFQSRRCGRYIGNHPASGFCKTKPRKTFWSQAMTQCNPWLGAGSRGKSLQK